VATLFIRMNQTFLLDEKLTRKWILDPQPGFSIQFDFAVESGSIGFQVPSSSFVEGAAKILSEGNQLSVNLSGVAKVKIYEMQETQFVEKSRLYVSGITIDGTYELIPVKTLAAAQSVQHNGEVYPLAFVEVGGKKTALVRYQ